MLGIGPVRHLGRTEKLLAIGDSARVIGVEVLDVGGWSAHGHGAGTDSDFLCCLRQDLFLPKSSMSALSSVGTRFLLSSPPLARTLLMLVLLELAWSVSSGPLFPRHLLQQQSLNVFSAFGNGSSCDLALRLWQDCPSLWDLWVPGGRLSCFPSTFCEAKSTWKRPAYF